MDEDFQMQIYFYNTVLSLKIEIYIKLDFQG